MELNLSCVPWILHRWNKSSFLAQGMFPWCFKMSWLYSSFPLCPSPFLVVVLMLRWVSGEHVQGANLAENVSLFLFCGVGFWRVHLSELAGWTSASAGTGEEEARPWHWGRRDIRFALELDFEWQKPEVFGVERFHFSRERKDGGSGWWMYYNIFNLKQLWGSIFVLYNKLEACMLLWTKGIVSFCLLLPASPCSVVSICKFLAGKTLGNNSWVESRGC